MDYLFSLLCVCILVTFVIAEEGPCFNFPDTSYIHFSPNNFINNDAAHYRFRIKTKADSGIIMFAEGDEAEGDHETIFIRDGKLGYHLFNTSPEGIGGSFGGLFQLAQPVNTGDWITVNMYRSWPTWDARRGKDKPKTGIEATINGQVYSRVDHRNRTDITLGTTIYFGGYREPLSDDVGYFVGQIEDIYEAKNDHTFVEPSLNSGSRVILNCLETTDPL